MEEKTIEQEMLGVEQEEVIEEVHEQQGAKINMPDLAFLKAKTGEGSIEEYIEHPLNVNKSKGLARVIRGFTGMFGALDLAVIDIVLGIMEYTKERKSANVN